MCTTTAFIVSLCLAAAVTGSTVNSTLQNCTIEKRIESFEKTRTCVKDFLNNNGSCPDIDQVRKSYVSRLELGSKCFSNVVAQINSSIHLRLSLMEHAVKHAEIQGFYNANGTNCIRSKGHEILQCVENTIKHANKTTIHRQMRHSLIQLKPLETEEKTFIDSAKIYNCTLNILRNYCNQTIALVKSIGEYISEEIVKHKHVKSRPSPPAPSRKGTITIIIAVIVIVLLIVAFIVIKKILWPRWPYLY